MVIKRYHHYDIVVIALSSLCPILVLAGDLSPETRAFPEARELQENTVNTPSRGSGY